MPMANFSQAQRCTIGLQTYIHFYHLGAKLSAFIILVPNCPLYYLGAKLSGAKLSYNCGECWAVVNVAF